MLGYSWVDLVVAAAVAHDDGHGDADDDGDGDHWKVS